MRVRLLWGRVESARLPIDRLAGRPTGRPADRLVGWLPRQAREHHFSRARVPALDTWTGINAVPPIDCLAAAAADPFPLGKYITP